MLQNRRRNCLWKTWVLTAYYNVSSSLLSENDCTPFEYNLFNPIETDDPGPRSFFDPINSPRKAEISNTRKREREREREREGEEEKVIADGKTKTHSWFQPASRVYAMQSTEQTACLPILSEGGGSFPLGRSPVLHMLKASLAADSYCLCLYGQN